MGDAPFRSRIETRRLTDSEGSSAIKGSESALPTTEAKRSSETPPAIRASWTEIARSDDSRQWDFALPSSSRPDTPGQEVWPVIWILFGILARIGAMCCR